MRGKVSALVTRHCTDDLENRKPCHGGNQVFLDFDWNSTSQKRLLPRTHHVDRPRRSAAKSKSKQTKASANKMDTAKIGATHHATSGKLQCPFSSLFLLISPYFLLLKKIRQEKGTGFFPFSSF